MLQEPTTSVVVRGYRLSIATKRTGRGRPRRQWWTDERAPGRAEAEARAGAWRSVGDLRCTFLSTSPGQLFIPALQSSPRYKQISWNVWATVITIITIQWRQDRDDQNTNDDVDDSDDDDGVYDDANRRRCQVHN